jgi:hypothetical protein
VATGVFVERGVAAGLAYGFLEYVMPVLIVALIVVTLLSPPKKSAASYAR